MDDIVASAGSARERRQALIASELDTLYEVTRLLSRSLDPTSTFPELLRRLHDQQGICNGMIALLDAQSGSLRLSEMHGAGGLKLSEVVYNAGEGIVGQILTEGEPVLVPRISMETKFLDRTGVYDTELPFIGVPILTAESTPAGVLAAQPPVGNDLLGERARFLEMIATLIAQSLRLHRSIEQERAEMRDERDDLRRAVKKQHGMGRMVGGRTESMRFAFEQVRLVAKWKTSVLIRGESGTGKELVANAIHYNSPRASGPFVKLNCAALPDQLLESELFGHEKGAFTGATQPRKGRFEMADGGTLFLDEIGEISAAFQAKLLRVLQEGEFERVGGSKTLTVDVRVIAATNRDLEGAMETGEFREDLYYRLNVMPIMIPALRDRMVDLPDLAHALVERIAEKQGRPLEIDSDAVRALSNHDWPGNVRELENCLERASIMSMDGVIGREQVILPGGAEIAPSPVSRPVAPKPAAVAPASTQRENLTDPNLSERDRVIAALEEAGWVQARAARLLGMTPRQIAYRIQTLNITVRQL